MIKGGITVFKFTCSEETRTSGKRTRQTEERALKIAEKDQIID